MLKEIKTRYMPKRLQSVDPDFLDFEESMITEEDQELVQFLLSGKYPPVPNPHNSIILYLTGLTNDFDLVRARANTRGGSPPDVDIDFEALGRDQAVEQVIARWGRDNVANIITHGTFKPKSLSRRFFKIMEPEVLGETDPKKTRTYPHVKAHYIKLGDILDMIPDPAHGKEATVQELIEGNKKNGWKPHPELKTEQKYAPWVEFAEQLEGMVVNFGIHAAGIVISEFPIYEQVPMWKNGKSERITQYNMHEVEELGLTNLETCGMIL